MFILNLFSSVAWVVLLKAPFFIGHINWNIIRAGTRTRTRERTRTKTKNPSRDGVRQDGDLRCHLLLCRWIDCPQWTFTHSDSLRWGEVCYCVEVSRRFDCCEWSFPYSGLLCWGEVFCCIEVLVWLPLVNFYLFQFVEVLVWLLWVEVYLFWFFV